MIKRLVQVNDGFLHLFQYRVRKGRETQGAGDT